MEGIRHESRYHTDAQVREAVEKAAALVDELNLADDLRQPAFTQAVILYTAKNISIEPIVANMPRMAIPRGL